MKKHHLNWVTIGFAALALLVVVMMVMNTIRGPGEIRLPDTETVPDQSEESADRTEDTIMVIEITPDTVQAAIATLERPDSYQRTVTVEQFWTGGSAAYETAVAVSGEWTRTDRTMPDGRVRHTIIGSETVYVWYNSERDIYSGPVGEISADNEQAIPTYETILDLPADQIITADYRDFSGIHCIYVEAESSDEYTLRYWVSVDSGLLVAAEKLIRDEAVYRMAALTADLTEPSAEMFTLPNGTVLI